MGAKASTEKHPNDGENEKFKFGSCSMQGWRQTNEDAMISQLDIGDGNSVFAVFDGHGGEHVALFCKKHFVQLLKKKKTYKAKNYEKALEETFLQIDRMLLQKTG
jgi:protein phosphatase 1G